MGTPCAEEETGSRIKETVNIFESVSDGCASFRCPSGWSSGMPPVAASVSEEGQKIMEEGVLPDVKEADRSI